MPSLRTLTAPLITLALASCSSLSAPWTCTPDSCGAATTDDLPLEVLDASGRFWEDETGRRVQVARIGGADQPPLTTTAILHGKGFVEDGKRAQLFAFGDRVVVEERQDGSRTSPRRFSRFSVEGREMILEPLTLDPAPDALEAAGARVVETDDGPALVYDDVRDMARAITTLLADDGAWGEATVFVDAE